jgi:hypothetical protein
MAFPTPAVLAPTGALDDEAREARLLEHLVVKGSKHG